MADTFLSDVHPRLDRPDRGRRLAEVVAGLGPEDTLTVAGDLCDFWFASRQRRRADACEGLAALASYRRRGGDLTLMAGNHDRWLGPLYERVVGVGLVEEPRLVDSHGLRLSLVHGHRLGGRPAWKGAMESRAFLHVFGLAPRAAADRLDAALETSNDRTIGESEARHWANYRSYAEGLQGRADIAVFGHIHNPRDERDGPLRLVVLGGWQRRTSYLRVDERGASLHVHALDGGAAVS